MDSSTSIDFGKYKYLNIGGANWDHRADGWLNLDFPFEATAKKRDHSLIDIEHNLMSCLPLPIPDHCLDGVYTEHTIEHITYNAAFMLFSEAKRILRSGGFFRISCPDVKKFWRVLKEGKDAAKDFPKQWIPDDELSKEEIFLDAICSPIKTDRNIDFLKKSINDLDYDFIMCWVDQKIPTIFKEEQIKHPGSHISWWDGRFLKFDLNTAGFEYVYGPYERNESGCEEFRKKYIDTTAPACSLRMEARA